MDRRLRRNVGWILAVGLIALALVLQADTARAAGGGTIRGKMVNASANGGSVAGVEVTLTTYFGKTERNKSSTRTDADGNFQFENLDTNPNYSYQATTNYQKADYSTPRISFSGAEETRDVTLTVNDSTTQPEVVKASAKHYLLTLGNGELEVSEILVLNNTSDRSYIGSREVGPDQRETTRYQPPRGAKNVEYGDGLMSCCIVKDGEGFVDTMPIYPGEDQKIYSYRLPYGGTSLSFATTLQQDVEKLQFLVPNTGVRANISGLASHGTQNIQGASYMVFSGERLPANTTINVDLEGLPTRQFADNPAVLAGVAVAVLVALGAAFYLLRRRSESGSLPAPGYPASPDRGRPRTTVGRRGPSGSAALLELERRDLLAAMANLDDWFEAGRINRKDYERLRAEKKDRLIVISRQLAGRGAAGKP